MAQKIGPASLRLYTNKHFDALWFADRTYDTLLHRTLQTKTFLHTLLRKLGGRTALSHVQATSHTLFIHSFFCNPRHMNKRKERLDVPFKPHTQYVRRFEPFVALQNTFQKNALFSFCMASQSNPETLFTQGGSLFALLAMHYSLAQKHYTCSQLTASHALYAVTKSKVPEHVRVANRRARKTFKTIRIGGKTTRIEYTRKYAHHIESVLTRYLQKRVVWKQCTMRRVATSATFIAHYIALQFEQNKKKPSRYIFQDALRKCILAPRLIGARIEVAGCIGGADKARKQTAKFGQTSLHMFEHRIDYHATTALTRKGILGVKVWMSFTS